MLTSPKPILLLAVGLLLLPALLTHLGLLAFYGDEGIRALVALEMRISGNYITPTMFGELYYNKPPLYNWLLVAVFNLTGRTDEFIARLPTVFFLLAYAATVWFFVKKHLRPNPIYCRESSISQFPNFPILPALSLITCGRILFWDSMLALIDTSFSWVMYAMFMVIFSQGEREKYGRLFFFAYLLAAIGFMLKGLPAVVFLGIALVTYFFWVKKVRKLLALAHLGGMAVFGIVVGSYYLVYAQQNGGLSVVFSTLFSESAKRTFVEHGAGKTVLHIFTFPFEMWYHFLPWTLLVVYLLRKNALQLLLQHRFIAWNGLVFITTILPYWASVEVYPRYLLMHVPLAFTVLFYLHFKNREVGSPTVRWVEGIFQGLCWGMLAASFAPLWWKAVAHVPFLYLKVGFVAGAMVAMLWAYRRWEAQRMLAFVAVMLVARMAFNWFILPTRLEVDCNTQVRQTTLDAVQKLEGHPLFIYKESLGHEPVTGYYFTRETGQVLRPKQEDFDMNAYYILDRYRYKIKYRQIAKVKTLWQCRELEIVKIK